MTLRRGRVAFRLAALLVTVSLAGCLFAAPSATPSLAPSGSAAVSVPPSVSAPPPSPTAVPTPGPDDVPTFTAGTTVATNAGGLRVRSGPGTSAGVQALLPTGARLVIELGPVRANGHGWYLVRDADEDEPTFEEGWVAAGFMPNPYLTPASFELPFNPILAGFGHDGAGEFGPVHVEDANVTVRWVASPLNGSGCSFNVDFTPGTATPVPAIRATIGSAPAPGNLYGQFFAEHPELVGDLFVSVTSDCSWALTFLRTEPIGG
ncbi:MAG: SH3 domain-containing protein [Chloroflexota bacterium]